MGLLAPSPMAEVVDPRTADLDGQAESGQQAAHRLVSAHEQSDTDERHGGTADEHQRRTRRTQGIAHEGCLASDR
jgi:hypothetical protein